MIAVDPYKIEVIEATSSKDINDNNNHGIGGNNNEMS